MDCLDRKFNKIAGIYAIRNKIDSRLYIGSAIDLYKRTSNHKSDLIKNKHHSIHLQRFVNKHGIENLEVLVFESMVKKENLLQREQHYIDLYKSYDLNKGFNCTKIAGSRLGVKASEETKLKMSLSRIGSKKSEESKKNQSDRMKLNHPMKGKNISEYHKKRIQKSILQYDKNGNFIQAWESTILASKELNISKTSISNVLTGRSKVCGIQKFNFQYAMS